MSPRCVLFRLVYGLSVLALAGCAASTRVAWTPADQAPVCQPGATPRAAVLWRTQWRPDQKDVPEREAAAAQGMAAFLAGSSCLRAATVARATGPAPVPHVPPGADFLLVLTLRELGPTVQLFSSAALVEGGTEVVFDVAQFLPGQAQPARQYTVHWRHGGPGVVKGVQSLPADLAAALQVGLLGR